MIPLRSSRLVVRWCTKVLAGVAMVVIAGMMLTITYDVFMRFAFAAPTDWAYPLNAWAVLGSTMLAVPHLYVRRQHIAMDLVHRAMPRGPRRVADVVTAIATGALGTVLAATALRSLIVAVEGGLTGSGTFNIPHWVPNAVLLVTGLLLVLVAVLFPPWASDADVPEKPTTVPGEVGSEDATGRAERGEPA